jgi:pseudo-rSAM protein
MNKYWLTLFPDTFLWTKRDKILIYNSKKNQHLILDSSNEYKRLCNDLVDLDNLYSVEIKESQLKHKSIIDFIKKIEAVEAGILVEVSEHTPKPISYYPHLKLQRDLGLIKWEHERGIGGNIASNLHELTFYLNGSKNGNDTFFKQIIHPVNSVCDLYYSGVMKFISNCNGGMLYQVNLVGNLLDYPNLDELIEWLLLKKLKIKLFLLIDDFRLDSKRHIFYLICSLKLY